jgi:5-methylcytosine-specific restriction endonuclease McrA
MQKESNLRRINKQGRYLLWAQAAINTHRKRGHVVNITIQELADLAKNTPTCQICEEPLQYYGNGSGSHAKSASMDRVLNDGAYTISEIGILCTRCNALKGNIGFEKFKKVTEGFVKYIKKVDPDFSP